MSQAIHTLLQYASHVLLSLEVLFFLIGVLTLLTGRLVVAPRRYVDGGAARGIGFLLMMPMVAAFVLLFGLAVWAHLTYYPLDFQQWHGWVELGQAALLLLGLAASVVIAVAFLRVEQLEGQSPFRREKLLEQGPLALFILGVALAAYLSWGAAFWKQVLIWAPLVPAFGYLLRRGSVKLFGPVLFYDLMRSGRRGRFVLVRFLYCSILFLALMWVFFIFAMERRYNPRDNDVTHMARMADSFFYTFITLQLLVVVVLTPAYTAGAIADEKDRHTLEYLLATDLRNREIVLSKLVSRMANLSFMLLAGLPILSLMQFLGGVDPGLVLAGFAATALTMASLAALSILMSVYCNKPRDAIALTYLTALGYITIPWVVGEILKFAAPLFVGIPLALGDTRNSSVTVADAINWLNSGNLVKSYGEVASKVGRGNALADELEDHLRQYAIFHGLAILFFSFWAVVRLRAVALHQTFGKTVRLPFLSRILGRPPVGTSPMLWKEIFAEAGPRFGCMGRIVIGTLIILSFVPAIWIVAWAITEYFDPNSMRFYDSLWNRVRWAINAWVRVAGTGVACLTLLAVAVRAAGSVSGERDKETLDALLTSPLDSDNILFAKWLGSILSVRWAWLWLVLIWSAGVMLGGIQFFAPLLIAGAWFVLAGFFAMIGLWFSTVCKTTLRATVWTLGSVLFVGGGHWFLGGMCCYFPLGVMRVNGSDFEYIWQFHLFGMTPPATLGFMAIHGEEFEHHGSRENPFVWLLFCLMGVFAWGVAAAILWAPTSERFRQQTGRQRLKRPERRMMPFPSPAAELPGAWPSPIDDRPIPLDDAITTDPPIVLRVDESPEKRE